MLAGTGCDTVDLHFERAGLLRLRFGLTATRSAWPDPVTRADIERAGGRIDRTDQEITVQLPLVAPAPAASC